MVGNADELAKLGGEGECEVLERRWTRCVPRVGERGSRFRPLVNFVRSELLRGGVLAFRRPGGKPRARSPAQALTSQVHSSRRAPAG